MVTIAYLVETHIKDKPFLLEALSRGIINYAALADELKPDIEKELKTEIKPITVIMALRRFAEKLIKKTFKPIDYGPDAGLTLKSNLFNIHFLKSDTIFEKLIRMYKIVDFSRGGIFHVIQGTFEVTIATNQQYKEQLLKLFEGEKIVMSFDSVSSVSFTYSSKFINIPGQLFNLTKALAWKNINILELVETLHESIFLFKAEDASKAYDCLQKLITQSMEKN